MFASSELNCRLLELLDGDGVRSLSVLCGIRTVPLHPEIPRRGLHPVVRCALLDGAGRYSAMFHDGAYYVRYRHNEARGFEWIGDDILSPTLRPWNDG